MLKPVKRKWWHDKIAYQIYPKSFLDSNGDGIGDLKGIISKLDYLKALGVDIIWLSPIYKSPFVDQGYDISDYYAIAEEFGTMEEFDLLLAEAEKRDMHIIMDLVINHCSDKHEWFQKALMDPYGEYADYFYFRKGRDGEENPGQGCDDAMRDGNKNGSQSCDDSRRCGNPPNNLRSYFGGSCWEPVPGTDMYYFHMFAKEQPDLNWENPKLRGELYKMVNWWLEKGLAGFRVDAIINIKKDLSFPDFEPDGPDGLAHCWKMVDSVDGVGDLLQDLKRNTFSKYDAFTAGEVFNMHEGELENFIGDEGHFSTIFDFSAHCLGSGAHGWYDMPPVEFREWRQTVVNSQLEVQKHGFEANIIENHDEPRGVSRFLPEYARTPNGAKMLGTVSVLLRGIPFIYQGQEIGMQNAVWNSIDEFDDINTKDQYSIALQAGLSDEAALAACAAMSRDNARTPMQWSSDLNAGFTSGTPWLKVNSNYPDINVELQETDPSSVLNYYRRLIALRKSPEYSEVFTYGEFAPVYMDSDFVMAYYRFDGSQRMLIAANFGPEAAEIKLGYPVKRVVLGNIGENAFAGTFAPGAGSSSFRTSWDSAESTDFFGDALKLSSCEVVVIECEI
ncbi:MAG: alpha-glucosidase [Emergencia sp.]